MKKHWNTDCGIAAVLVHYDVRLVSSERGVCRTSIAAKPQKASMSRAGTNSRTTNYASREFTLTRVYDELLSQVSSSAASKHEAILREPMQVQRLHGRFLLSFRDFVKSELAVVCARAREKRQKVARRRAREERERERERYL